ncbi:autotransporter assembly complex protein TamA [Lichenicoccus roseus]|uniref:Outer membrane protein assembly factor n=1 Tax=Lichenicoccus roseus TaxID=2683649 RepID=A0A5R9J398_9PROT|nr:autotransporter assembly complex family protein [Lichenicoccus roseus]TLU72032.1 outer membrane protein assembly factor [Lichenicoccus roseus]
MTILPACLFHHRAVLRRARSVRLSWVAALLWVQPALAADPQPYKTTIAKTGNPSLDAALAGSSSLISLQKLHPIGPFALAGRARADYARLQTALESFGYYAGTVSISVAGHAGDDATLPDVLAAIPKGRTAPVKLSFTLGPLFTLGRVTLTDPGHEVLSPVALDAFGLKTGQPAIASDVLAAQGRLLSALREEGHALADVKPPVATLRPQDHTIDVAYTVHEGPRVDIGTISLDGLKRVHEDFIRRHLLLHPGQLYQPSAIEAARQDLAGLGVFSDVAVRTGLGGSGSDPRQLQPDGRIPLTFDFTEGLRHTVSAQAGYSTDLGGSAGVTWTHHNLFGNAEQLDLTALATGIGGTAEQGLGYDVFANLTKPDFWHRDQSLVVRIEGLKQNLQAYDQTALLVRVGLNRKLSKDWSVAAGIAAEQEQIDQEGVTRDYTLASIPLSASYDSTDLANPLDAATHGIRASLGATPTESFVSGSAFFTILQATGSTYFDLARVGLASPGRSVIAVRATVGSVQGASTFQLPPDQRLYAGGSSTVRGFKYQGVGPQFADGYPVGGTSLDAATFEFRQRLFKSFGAAAFVDAGQVSSRSAPLEGTLRVGAGVGARYYTPIGPIRVDVAVPLNKPQGGDSFELYVGLGETF